MDRIRVDLIQLVGQNTGSLLNLLANLHSTPFLYIDVNSIHFHEKEHETPKGTSRTADKYLTSYISVIAQTYSKQIEKIHNQFCKRYIGLHQNAADFFALSECGKYPLAVTYMTQCKSTGLG